MRVDQLFAKSLVGKTVRYDYDVNRSVEGCVLSLKQTNGKFGLFEITIRSQDEKVASYILLPEKNIEILS